MTNSTARSAGAEISSAIEEAAKQASNVSSVQNTIERLLRGTLEQRLPRDRIQSAIDVILEEDILSDDK